MTPIVIELDNDVVDARASAVVNDAIASKQDILSRDPVGDYGTFGMLSMRESGYPRGSDSLTAPQQATYEKAWGVATASVTVNSGGTAGTYYDNTLMFGFNVHGQVYDEASVRLTFESKWTNTGNSAEWLTECHIDGLTEEGTYMRPFTLTMPRNDSQSKDTTSAISLSAQLVVFADYSGNGTLAIDSRSNQRRVQVAGGATLDLRGVAADQKNIRQLIDAGTNLWAFLPYADYESSEIKIKSDYPLLVNGRMIATARVAGSEFRVADNPVLQLGKACGAGYVTGFNMNEGSGVPKYAADGFAAGFWILQNAVRVYGNASGTTGGDMGVWVADFSPNPSANESGLRLWHPAQGNWMRVKFGSAGSGPGGTGRALFVD
jgi:hypothetical protein